MKLIFLAGVIFSTISLVVNLPQGLISLNEHDGRIIGGEVIPIEAAPYQASIQYLGKHICGGVVLHTNVILTAAHCFEGLKGETDFGYSVRVGSDFHYAGGQLARVVRIRTYPTYAPTNLDGDLAMLLLAGQLVYSKKVQPIVIAHPNDTMARLTTKLSVTGWGLTRPNGFVATKLNRVFVDQFEQSICAKTYNPLVHFTKRMLCAGAKAGGRDSCQGDSGGPLVRYVNNKAELCGIVSWGIGCGESEFPGVYAKVYDEGLLQWIQTTTHQLQNITKA